MKDVISLITGKLSMIKSNVQDVFKSVNDLNCFKNCWVSDNGNIVLNLTRQLKDSEKSTIVALFDDVENYQVNISDHDNANRESMRYLDRCDSKCLVTICAPKSIDDLLSC
ncbi:MAG TPA: hypothetical protein DCM40_37375 [Maribacter sp.]|nr:hypothetical protein [Maribacter sp.]|tara:strand:+ start:771 stop:1103 length:333 start_codon:yes stop_codon:yes gene_type:complete